MQIVGPLSGSTSTFIYAILKDFTVYIKRRRRRVIDLMEDFDKLRLEESHLSNKWKDLNERIELLSSSVQKTHQHSSLSRKVGRVKKMFRDINKQYMQLCGDLENQRSSDEEFTIIKQEIWSRRFFKLARLDKDVAKLTSLATEVRNDLEFTELTSMARPNIVEKLNAEKLDNVGDSHQNHLNRLLEYVGTHKRIGIYGNSGVGKTNIIKNLNNYFISSSSSSSPSSSSNLRFDYVIWVTVQGNQKSENIVENIQNEIIERLKIPGGSSRGQNSSIISSTLSNKKYLLLLDSFSRRIKLEDIGILEVHEHGRIVMEAKCLNDLRYANSDVDIKVEPLSHHESWILFSKFFDSTKLSKEEEDVVDLILRQLGGFPQFIKFIAKSLSAHRRDFCYWQGLKQRLESDAATPELLGLAGLSQFYSRIYEDLDENFKKCLLYAALYPKNYMIPINYLIECWKAENLLNPSVPLKDVRIDGMYVFTHLEENCLLESPCDTYVKMPTMLRKLAIELLCPKEASGSSSSCFFRLQKQNDGHITPEEWNNARWVSLMRSNIERLPKSPKCSGLSTLLLQKNPKLMSIEDAFFTYMCNLLVLDLHATRIQLLPSSISALNGLRCLYLNECRRLNVLPTNIGQLQSLEVLDIRNTSIYCLEDGIFELASLRCLRFSYEAKRQQISKFSNRTWLMFPPLEDNKLSNLQELTIDFDIGVSDEVINQVTEEVEAGFKGLSDFQKNLNCDLGSLEPHPIEILIQNIGDITEASSVVRQAMIVPSIPSNAVELQSNKNEIPDGVVTTVNHFPDCKTSFKGKEIVEQPKEKTEQCNRFGDPSETDRDDLKLEDTKNNLKMQILKCQEELKQLQGKLGQLESAPLLNNLDREAGEGPSETGGSH